MRGTRAAVIVAITALLIHVTPTFASTGEDIKAQRVQADDNQAPDMPRYQGKTLSYWLKVIRDQDEELISFAFEAIRSLGSQAWLAVPELTRLVAAPFTPIQIGKDSDEVIACKLYDIEVRSEAIDSLASIGEAASPATTAVVQWALTVRVVLGERLTKDEDERFLELVALDAKYRIRVIDAIVQFGNATTPILLRLLKSPDVEKRKFAVVILGENTVTIAMALMKSNNCEDKKLAIALLGDMTPFVSKIYLSELNRTLVCDGD